MIEGYKYETAPLTEYEKETLLPIFIKCLQRKIGKENAITNKMMCYKLEEYGYKVSETRIRKLINFIRTNNLISCLVASGNGYYVADNPKDIKEHIRSLKGRVAAILAVIEALQEQAGLGDYDCYLDDEQSTIQ